jgi:hypothetical protein
VAEGELEDLFLIVRAEIAPKWHSEHSARDPSYIPHATAMITATPARVKPNPIRTITKSALENVQKDGIPDAPCKPDPNNTSAEPPPDSKDVDLISPSRAWPRSKLSELYSSSSPSSPRNRSCRMAAARLGIRFEYWYAARIIAKAAIRGTTLSLVIRPDGEATLLIYWGHNPDPRDIPAELTARRSRWR